MKKRKKRKENPIDRVAASAALVACVYRDLCGFTPDEISLVKTYLARMGVDYDHKELIPMMRAYLAERLVECVDRGLLPDVVRALPECRKKCRLGRLCLKHFIPYIQARNIKSLLTRYMVALLLIIKYAPLAGLLTRTSSA
jgi:hypothetical protein